MPTNLYEEIVDQNNATLDRLTGKDVDFISVVYDSSSDMVSMSAACDARQCSKLMTALIVHLDNQFDQAGKLALVITSGVINDYLEKRDSES